MGANMRGTVSALIGAILGFLTARGVIFMPGTGACWALKRCFLSTKGVRACLAYLCISYKTNRVVYLGKGKTKNAIL